jgi:hypothetical protein
MNHGIALADPASRPCTEPLATGLWNWLQSVAMLVMFSSRAFCDPCGVWQPVQPSARTAACSKTNGPSVSMSHFVQTLF